MGLPWVAAMEACTAMALPRGRPWGGDDYAMELHETAMEPHGTLLCSWHFMALSWPFRGTSCHLMESRGTSWQLMTFS